MNKILTNIVALSLLLSTFVYAGGPVSKEAKLIERVNSSESLIEATGKFISKEKKEKKAKKDVDANGMSKATKDAKKAAVYFILFGGTDPMINTTQERQAFDSHKTKPSSSIVGTTLLGFIWR